MPGMTAGDPLGAHQAALEQAVALDRLLGVVRAGGLVAAARREPREHDSVDLDQSDSDPFHAVLCPSRTPPRRRSLATTSASSSWLASTSAGRAMIRTSQPGWNEGASALSTSRMRRRSRLRITAPPHFLPGARP